MTVKHEAKIFVWPMRVYWEDTDAGGIVYNASYLNFAQRARSEFMRAFVCKESECLGKFGVQLVVRHAEIDYRASAKLDDMLDVSAEIIHVGNTSIGVVQHVRRENHLLATVKMTLVATSPGGKAVRIPPQLRQIFSSHKAAE
ncbi:MAG: YbgC/FadM family acyl-CoA thioesterase [Alphaproteobacteria bacterium]|nr:YbgC/FadM family acyl-CoA thioesterase [Alphaproteobacteria bacterium]